MKKLFLLLGLFFSANLYAQTAVVPGEIAIEKFLNTTLTKETLTTGAKRAAGVLVLNKGKTLLAAGTIVTYNYLIDNPQEMAGYFSTHPEALDKFTQYVQYRILNANTAEDYQKFSHVKQQLALDPDELEQIRLENSPTYKTIENEVIRQIALTDAIMLENGQTTQGCTVNDIGKLLMKHKDFNEIINNQLPYIAFEQDKTYILDVNSFKILKKGYQKTNKQIVLQIDHIPSYKALHQYLKNHGYQPKEKLLGKRILRDNNLEFNTTAIAIPEKIHQNGRTYSGRNTPKQIDLDANDLLVATIKDIATTALRLSEVDINSNYSGITEKYIQSSMVIYARNKLLCLYDIK